MGTEGVHAQRKDTLREKVVEVDMVSGGQVVDLVGHLHYKGELLFVVGGI